MTSPPSTRQTTPAPGARAVRRPSAGDPLTPARRRLALLALAVGGFGIGCSEFVSMGLLPGIARSLLPGLMAADPEAGIARAGWAISAYAAGVVVGAPVVAVLAVRASRTRLIVLLAAALAVSTVLSAAMPTFELTVLARFVAGLPHGAYFGVSSLIAASLMGPGSQGKGIALALSGLTIANLVGVPLLTAFGQGLGWRVSYLMIAGVFAVTVAMLLLAVPRQESVTGRGMREELAAFGSTQVWAVCGIAAVGFAGMFAIYSYIADITVTVAGAPESFVPIVLACAGLGMTLGNALGGVLADRSENRVLLLGFPVYVLTLASVIVLSGSPVGLAVAVFAVNLAHMTVTPAVQAWLIRASGTSEVLGAALNHAAFNIANTIGATTGGLVIAAGLGYRAPAVVAVALAVCGYVLIVIALATRRSRRRRRARLAA